MIRTAVDTSIIIAALLPWHESHGAAFHVLETVLTEEGALVLPFPALVEAYSVLTRLPAPHRIGPQDAVSMLASVLLDTARIVSLETGDTWKFLQASAVAQTAGGAIYDALILACAEKAGVERIFTLNLRHFERLRPVGLQIETPV